MVQALLVEIRQAGPDPRLENVKCASGGNWIGAELARDVHMKSIRRNKEIGSFVEKPAVVLSNC